MRITIDLKWSSVGQEKETNEGKYSGSVESWEEIEKLIAYLKENYSYQENTK